MRFGIGFALLIVALGSALASAPVASAQEPRRAAGPVRKLAPGVLTVIDPGAEPSDTVSRHAIVDLLSRSPAYLERADSQGRSPAKLQTFNHEVFGLEFGFKPLRLIEADVPTATGKMQRTLVTYLVYRVRNLGDNWVRSQDDAGQVSLTRTPKPVRFVPRFVLESHDTKKLYSDVWLPTAVPAIQFREDPARPLNGTMQIAGALAVAESETDDGVWGVAMWPNLDPRTDRLTIYVQGLTNAYQWIDPPGAADPAAEPGTGRIFYQKTLALKFWRPGDEFADTQDLYRYEGHRWAFGQLTPDGFAAIISDLADSAAGGSSSAEPTGDAAPMPADPAPDAAPFGAPAAPSGAP
jgi:hypothetical protein